MKKNSLVKTKSGHIFFITDVDANANFGVQGQLVVKMWCNGQLVYDIENDDSKRPKLVALNSYLSEWGFDDEEIETKSAITAACWDKNGNYSYEAHEYDVAGVGTPKQYDAIKLDGLTEDSKKTLVYLDYDKEFRGWFKEENYTPSHVKTFEDDRWSKVLNKKTYRDSY